MHSVAGDDSRFSLLGPSSASDAAFFFFLLFFFRFYQHFHRHFGWNIRDFLYNVHKPHYLPNCLSFLFYFLFLKQKKKKNIFTLVELLNTRRKKSKAH